jgi:pilus assembly protein FimV
MRATPILKLSLLASAIALALPGSALALGLGKLTLNSSLGQPLSAEIELTSTTKDEISSVAAKIADASLYRQNNLTYPGVLTRARVTLDRNAAGQPILRITTPGPVNEPYLDLLVDVSWAAGRTVRDYTFLLDPPGVGAPAPVEPVAPVRAGAAPARPAAAAPAPAPSAEPRSGAAAGGTAGTHTVRRGETLSRIATEYKAPTITLDQMLVALFKANQGAFDGNNMNRLRAGSIVTIPSADDAAATAAAEAQRIVKVQSSDWRSYRDRVAGAAPEAEGAAGRAAAGRIGAVVEEKPPAAPAGRDQLKVSREAGAAKGAGAAAEDAVAREKQIRDAQARITELEKTLKDLQRAVELKSQTMAQLQAQADAAKGKAGEPTKAPVPAPAPPAAAAPEPAKAAPPVAPSPAVEPPKAAEAPKVEAPKAEAPKVEAPKAEPPKAEPAKAPPVPPKAAPKAAPKAEPSLVDELMSSTPTWAIGGGALAVLGGIAALIAARRRKSTKFEDSIVSGTDIKTNTVFGSTGGGVVNTGENSLASGFSNEGMGTIDTDEVDPIAEAEVYLAYGRDAQAEEILKEALKKDPQRQEIHLKLLEIHAQHNKPSAFETVASELYSVTQGRGEVWQKAVALGRQLDPGNPMFAEGGAGPAAAVAAAGAAAAVIASAGGPATRTTPEVPPVAPAPSAAEAAELGEESLLDFRLDDEISMAPTPTPESKAPPEAPAAESPPAAIPGAVEKAKAAGLDIAGVASTARPDLDFGHVDSAKPAPLATPQAAIDLDALDLSFGREHVPVEDQTPSVLDGQWHDAATKLDLAKAYQEMGDVEGAREILQEVLHEGDDQQKAEAQSLIAKLG